MGVEERMKWSFLFSMHAIATRIQSLRRSPAPARFCAGHLAFKLC
jgi:hypothetical protein